MVSEIWITEADRERERCIAAAVAAAWGLQVHHFPDLCVLDWYFYKGPKVVAVAELKCHSRWHERFMVSASKYEAAIHVGTGLGVPGLILVRVPDGEVRWHQAAATAPHHTDIMPRPDRGGSEPCVFIDWQPHFKVALHA